MREHQSNEFLNDLFDYLIGNGVSICFDDKSDIPFCDEDDDIKDCDSADCEGCPFECDYACEIDDDIPFYGVPEIDRVVFNDPATIVFWEDGTKTVVKCMKGERFERYAGFAAACMKKMFGSTSHAKAIMDSLTVESTKREKKHGKEEAEQMYMFGDKSHIQTMDEAIKEAVDEALTK